MTAERGQAMASHANRKRNGMAFGVDPTRKQFYSLRQARYDRLGEQVAELGHQLLKEKGRKADVLDIGPWDGVMLRHLEGHGGLEAVNYSAADLELYEGFYGKAHIKRFFPGNLMDGYPEIESEAYDVVVCEQVLEHLSETPNAIKTLERVLRPGGTLIVGVPIFMPPLHLIRHWGQPRWDRIFPPGKVRGHLQSFSAASIKAQFAALTSLEMTDIRGFRIFSGGVFAPLEEKEWWWRLARAAGRIAPSLCVEIQITYKKPLKG